MRIELRALCVALSLIAAAAVFGQDAQTTARGNSPTGAAASSDVDNINLFNGNLTVRVPISPSFPLDGGASYGISMTFTGQPWDFVGTSRSLKTPTPNRRSNAGTGWIVGMGRLISPSDTTNTNSFRSWIYASPDGSDHRFYDQIHPADCSSDPAAPNHCPAGIQYTRDNTYLRLRENGSTVSVDFPNGVRHVFDATSGELKEIWTPFDTTSPSVSIQDIPSSTNPLADCKDDQATSGCFIINDKFNRTSYITFTGDGNVYYRQRRVHQIILPAASPDPSLSCAAHPPPLVYSFWFKDGGVTTLPQDSDICYAKNSSSPNPVYTPLLDHVTFPDGTNYSFDYYNDAAGVSCSQGSLKTLTLPTSGIVSYTYQNYLGPVLITDDDDPPYTPGVHTVQRDGGTWTYTTAKTLDKDYAPGCVDVCSEPAEFKVTLDRPDGARTVNYFSVAKHTSRYASNTEGWTSSEYGLPLTRRASLSHADPFGVTRFLSTQIQPTSTGAVSRSTYLTYENDGNLVLGNDNDRRVVGALTVFDLDGKSVATQNSNFDGFGHYRTATTKSSGFQNAAGASIDSTKIATINFNPTVTYSPSTALVMPATWILGTFDYRQLQEGTSTFRSDACYDAATGFLNFARQRTNASAPSSTDIVTAYSVEAGTGNVAVEKTFGGDDSAHVTDTPANLCSSNPSSSPVTEIHHTYSYGVRSASIYYSGTSAMPFKSLDQTIDPIGVPASSRDVSLHQTLFTYDCTSRLYKQTPPPAGSDSLTYTYTNASAGVAAAVTTSQSDKTTTSTYDGFGRLTGESHSMPGGTAQRSTAYDAMGRRTAVSEWRYSSEPVNQTLFDLYDEFGRLKHTTMPDLDAQGQHHAIGTTYTNSGIAVVQRTSTVGTASGTETTATTAEYYDAFGRLRNVVEPSGTITNYAYDAADHLVSVCVNTSNCQNRTFTYDGRGFLTKEVHPENGETDYLYDGRGHVIYKQIGTGQSDRDLIFTYDAAERLTKVEQRKSGTGRTCASGLTCQTLKDFTYGTTGNLLGRLQSATRHNYDASSDRTVTETYSNDDGGRLKNIATDIAKDGVTLKSISSPNADLYDYDTSGQITAIHYPTCANCGGSAFSVAQTWSNGFLTGVTNFADFSRAANGMVTSVVHKNSANGATTTDTYTEDPNQIPRPASIKFESYAACSAPSIAAQPSNQTASNGSATLSVAPSNLHYQWYQIISGSGVAISGATNATLAVTGISQNTSYYVVVYNSCGQVTSATATVFVPTCPSISATTQSQTIASGQSLTLSVTANGDPTLHYQWYRGSSGDTSAPVGSDSSSYPTGALFATTRYWVRVSNGCSTPASSGTILLTIALPKPASLQATASVVVQPSTWQVSVSWQPSPGADHYQIYRIADAQTSFTLWQSNVTASPITDSIAPGTVRAYYVVAVDSSGGSASPPSDPDIASAVTLTPVSSQGLVRFQDFNQLLDGINAIRLATGHATVTWADIVPAGVPVPTSGNVSVIYATQVKALRDALDAARALFTPPLPVISYTNPISGDFISATHVNLLIGGMQ